MAGLSQQAAPPPARGVAVSPGQQLGQAVNMIANPATVMPKYQFSCEAVPQYLPEQSAPEDHVYGFSYTVTVTNTGEVTAQLISRHWVISDANGHNEEVKGLGVVGHQPLLKPGESFQYTSGSRLRTPTGTMHGSYFCVAEDGERFEAPIPMFVLEAQSGDGSGGIPPGRVLH
jgi:ApaG protein